MLLASACSEPAVDPSESLVGARELPSSRGLSREIVQLNRGYGQISEGFLSYELKPDDSVTVTHEDREERKVIGSETFRLEPNAAAQARRTLWRLRPARLEGQGMTRGEVRPEGCERQGPHDFGMIAVVFIDEGRGPSIEDDRLGAFELPDADSCSSPAAVEARSLIAQLFRLLPPSRVAAAFPQSK